MGKLSFEELASLSFESFRRLALDPELSEHERVGFPDVYRAGKIEAIAGDIAGKLFVGAAQGGVYLEIGPGSSSLAVRLIEMARERGLAVYLVDSPEMLAGLPDGPDVVKVAGKFPDVASELEGIRGQVQCALAYSVAHYAFAEGMLEAFVDSVLELLAPGGRFLLGDIPNESKRMRFLRSPRGAEFARRFLATYGANSAIDRGKLAELDDRVLLKLLERARQEGFDAYLLLQAPELPMANRREDLLFVRP